MYNALKTNPDPPYGHFDFYIYSRVFDIFLGVREEDGQGQVAKTPDLFFEWRLDEYHGPWNRAVSGRWFRIVNPITGLCIHAPVQWNYAMEFRPIAPAWEQLWQIDAIGGGDATGVRLLSYTLNACLLVAPSVLSTEGRPTSDRPLEFRETGSTQRQIDDYYTRHPRPFIE